MATTSTQASGSSGTDVLFKKKRNGPRSLRKPDADASATVEAGSSTIIASLRTRSADRGVDGGDDDDHDDAAESAVVVKAKRKAHNPLSQSTLPSYKRLRKDGEVDDDNGDFDIELADEDAAGAGYAAKRRHVDRFGETGVTSRSKAGGGAADGVAKVREDATRHSNWDLEVDDTGKARDSGGSIGSTATKVDGKANNDDGIYRGAKGYSSFVPTRDDGTSSKMRSRGPIRMSTNVRSVTVMDYQPDICKDYKETGYCGFGDTCKFLHDRSDYLAGWELDLLPNSNSRRGRGDFASDPEDGDDSDEEDVPFACLICRQPFTDPVVTNCGHYFCSACAIKRYTKTSKCFACGAQTGGLFNSATKVLKRMEDAKKRKAEERSERRRMHGYDDGDEQRGGEAEILEGVEIGGS
ncbi:related to Pre-mRNA-splicing factor CWC24 [Pseudozyma flocculosa]|nr:related to Pre-mRNA-splicing factor CWC24 [Pseudozyma flocculosa]